MRVLIIGGSGRTGKLVIDELQRRGKRTPPSPPTSEYRLTSTDFQVTALVRDPGALNDFEKVDIITGTPTKLDDVRSAFRNNKPDAVIVTLNARRASDSPFAAVISPPRFMADCNANVVAAMKEFGVEKLVVMQAFGVGASWPNMSCILRTMMSKSNMIYQYEDHNHIDREIRESGVTFVLVRPSRLVESDDVKVREWPNDGKGVGLMGSSSRKSVAKFLVDVATESKWDNTAPVITN